MVPAATSPSKINLAAAATLSASLPKFFRYQWNSHQTFSFGLNFSKSHAAIAIRFVHIFFAFADVLHPDRASRICSFKVGGNSSCILIITAAFSLYVVNSSHYQTILDYLATNTTKRPGMPKILPFLGDRFKFSRDYFL
jgi:hypothetical protein